MDDGIIDTRNNEGDDFSDFGIEDRAIDPKNEKGNTNSGERSARLKNNIRKSKIATIIK